MGKHRLLTALLIIQTIGLLSYTAIAYQTEGADLFGVFVANIKSLTWSG